MSGKKPCWATCHHSARNAETDNWLNGRCPYNVRLDDGQSALAGSLIKCKACGKCTCRDCLNAIQHEGNRLVGELRAQGLVMEPFAAFERVLAGSHRTAPVPASGAIVAADEDGCVWCRDTRKPDVVGALEPVAFLKELGIDEHATYAAAKPALTEEKMRCARLACAQCTNCHCHLHYHNCHNCHYHHHHHHHHHHHFYYY